MKSTKPANVPKVTPPAGWLPHSAYGALRDLYGKPMERLEVIHAFLMERDGLSSSDAAIRIFGPFVADANSALGLKHSAKKLRSFLMVCDRADKAAPLFPVGEYADRSSQERLLEVMPYVPHHHFDRDTPEGLLYAMGNMAGEVWAPAGGEFDLNDRPCAEFAEGDFPSVEKAGAILGPIAVRHDLAHQLWGWGTAGIAGGQTEMKPLPENWKPVSGWLQESAFGFAGGLGADGQSVDLVRLSDLVRWWQKAKSVPRAEALEAVVKALPADVMTWLYKITSGKRAAVVDPKSTFGQPTEDSLKKAKVNRGPIRISLLGGDFVKPFSGNNVGGSAAKVVPVVPGRPALLQYLGKWVSVRSFRTVAGAPQDTLDSTRDLLAYLAIPHAKAYELFGWGELDPVEAPSSATELPKTWAELKRYRKANAGHAWTQEMRQILVTEEGRRKQAGAVGIRKSMADELGSMTQSGLGDQMRKANTGTKSGRGRQAA